MDKVKKQYSILFIEDEKEIREDYVRYLKRHFLNVYEASDGEDGLKIYQEKKPDILIIDINIPKLSGIDVAVKIRKTDHTSKIIMLTAHGEIEYLMKSINLKLTKYLIKPISRIQLKEALDIAVNEFSLFETKSKKIIILNESFQWNIEKKELTENNIIIKLTVKEQLLLNKLFTDNQKIFTYDEIIMDLWIYDIYEGDKMNSLKTIVKNLRKKLPKDLITNIFGVGFKLGV